jgi:hypothetical protein
VELDCQLVFNTPIPKLFFSVFGIWSYHSLNQVAFLFVAMAQVPQNNSRDFERRSIKSNDSPSRPPFVFQ